MRGAEAAAMPPQASTLLPWGQVCVGSAGGVERCLQPPEDLGSTLFIQTDADECSAIVDRPVPRVPIACNTHDVCSLRAMGQSMCPALVGAIGLCTSLQRSCGTTRSGPPCDSASSARCACCTNP